MTPVLRFGYLLLLASVAQPTARSQSADEYRTFTSTDGKQIEAKPVSASEGSVRIEMKDGRSFDLPLSRLIDEDQKWIAEWKTNQAGNYVPKLKIDFDENIEESTDETGFVYIETLKPVLEIASEEETFDLADAKATILLLVEDMENEDVFLVLSKEQLDLAVPAGETVELTGKQAETKYATIRAYGAKYAGHAVVIESSSGKVIAHIGSRGWDKNPENALKVGEGATVQEDFVGGE